MLSINLTEEFHELIGIAQEIILDQQTHSMPIEEFLQLVLDMRNAERGTVDLTDKHIFLPEKNLIQ